MRVAKGPSAWVLGVADEGWWWRLAQPALPAWAAGQPLRLPALPRPQDDPDPTAIAGDGLLQPETPEVRVRFVDGRPLSPVTTAFRNWVCEPLKAAGKKARWWGWDKASGPLRQEVRGWIGAHHRHATGSGGGRSVVCQLPLKSPGLKRLEPPWVHAKRAIVEPHRLLSKTALVTRICSYFNGKYAEHLQQVIAKKVA